jgi:hypothetical protein
MLCDFFGLFIFENDANVHSKINKQIKLLKNLAFVGFLMVYDGNNRIRILIQIH